MKSHQTIFILLVLIGLIFLAGCGGNKSQLKQEVLSGYFPEWWNSKPDEAFVYSYGQAVKISEVASLDAAKAKAMLVVSDYVEAYVKVMLDNYIEDAGIKDPQMIELSEEVLKTVSNSRFAKIVTGMTENILVPTPEGERYKVFVQLKIPSREINKNLINHIRDNEALYNQFRESKAFRELDESLQ